MNRSELAELKAMELAKSIFVIVIEQTNGVKRLVKDPGMDQPWHTKNKKYADSTADEIAKDRHIRKAAAMTLEEAFNVLQRDFAETHKLKFK